MAAKQTYLFSSLALFYFIICALAANAVSQSIANYIGENGWEQFNTYTFLIGGIFALAFVLLLGFRIWVKFPRYHEILVGMIGFGLTFFILNHFVLLTTEYIHIPQFIILTLLLCLAFPRTLFTALAFSALACIVDEWIQSWMPNRVLDFNDILLNFIGLFFGLVIWWCISTIIHDSKRESLYQDPSTRLSSGKGVGV